MGDTRIGVAAAGGDGAEVLARIQQLEENGVHAAMADDRWERARGGRLPALEPPQHAPSASSLAQR